MNLCVAHEHTHTDLDMYIIGAQLISTRNSITCSFITDTRNGRCCVSKHKRTCALELFRCTLAQEHIDGGFGRGDTEYQCCVKGGAFQNVHVFVRVSTIENISVGQRGGSLALPETRSEILRVITWKHVWIQLRLTLNLEYTKIDSRVNV